MELGKMGFDVWTGLNCLRVGVSTTMNI